MNPRALYHFLTFVTGQSHETRYDWTDIAAEAREPAESTLVSVDIPCHEQVTVKQAVGRCGEHTIKTERIRTFF